MDKSTRTHKKPEVHQKCQNDQAPDHSHTAESVIYETRLYIRLLDLLSLFEITIIIIIIIQIIIQR